MPDTHVLTCDNFVIGREFRHYSYIIVSRESATRSELE